MYRLTLGDVLSQSNWQHQFDNMNAIRKQKFLIFFQFNFLIQYIFGHVPMVYVSQCDLFGQLQIFWSYSFSHLDLVKWVFLKIGPTFFKKWIIIVLIGNIMFPPSTFLSVFYINYVISWNVTVNNDPGLDTLFPL